MGMRVKEYRLRMETKKIRATILLILISFDQGIPFQ